MCEGIVFHRRPSRPEGTRMTIALYVVTIFLAVALTFSAIGKLTKSA